MEIKIETTWLNAKDFETMNPIIGTIKDVKTEKNKWNKDDYIVIVQFGLDERRKTLYKPDLIAVCGLYGTDTDKWKGKQIRFERNLDPETQKSIIKVRPL
jgi:hypothetical protein